MSWASTVPGSIAALVAAFAGAANKVFDGPILTSEALPEVLTVAWQADGTPSIEWTDFTVEGYAALPDREKYLIHCAIAVWSGSADDVPTGRTRAFAIFAAAGAAVAANPTLSGTVMLAQIGKPLFEQRQFNQGLVAAIDFSVDIDAYTTT